MKTVEQFKIFRASAESVFDCIDDLGITGMHMTESPMPMMGGKMNLEFLTSYKTGLGTKYRWTGKVMWWPLDFTVEVTKWIKGKEKVWETAGPVQLVIYSWFKMNLRIWDDKEQSVVFLSISYEKPKGIFNKFLCLITGRWYSRWCLNNMLNDTEKRLNTLNKTTNVSRYLEA